MKAFEIPLPDFMPAASLYENEMEIVPVSCVRCLLGLSEINFGMANLELRQGLVCPRIGQRMMLQLNGEVLLQLWASGRTGTPQTIVAAEGVRHPALKQILQTTLDALGDQERRNVRPRTDEELACMGRG